MSKTTKLIYRGHTFNYPQELLPQSLTELEDYPTQTVTARCGASPLGHSHAGKTSSGPLVKLIYRGLICERAMPVYPIHRKSQAINWRFQIPSKSKRDRFLINPA
jgi:hypothetical protein